MNTEIVSDNIGIISRQTDYDTETIKQKLLEHNNNTTEVIREYMKSSASNTKNINKKQCNTKLSVNQQIYKEIRGMMDDAARTYELNKNL